MAQQKPEKLTVKELLLLTDQLSPEEHEEFAEEFEIQWLRKELKTGTDELARGESLPAEDVIAELRARNKSFREKGST